MPRPIQQEIRLVDKTKQGFNSITSSIGRLRSSFAGLGALVGAGSFSLLAKQSIDTADKIAKLSDRLGVSTEALSQYRYVADRAGVSFETLTMGLQRMTRRISEAAAGTGEARGALKELGLNAQALNQLQLDQQFEILADAIISVENPADRVRLAMKLFDSEGVALIQTMQRGAEGIRDMRNEADRLGLTLDASTAESAERAKDNISELRGAFEGLGFTLIDVAEGPLDLITGALVGMTELIRNGAADVRNFIRALDVIDGPYTRLNALRELEVKLNQKLEELESRRGGHLTSEYERTDQLLQQTEEKIALLNEEIAQREKLLELEESTPVQINVTGGIEAITTAQKQSIATTEEWKDTMSRALDLIEAEFEELEDAAARDFAGIQEKAVETGDQFKELKTTIEGWGRDFADTLLDADKSFKDFVSSLLKQFARIALSKLTDPLFSMFGDFATQAAGSIFGRAAGGPVAANQAYVVGEQGPEIFVPSSAGSIIPNGKVSAGGGGAVGGVVVNLIESPGNGGKTNQRQEGGQFVLDVFVEQIRDAMISDVRSGGPLARSMSQQFGLNRTAGAY